MIEIKQVSITTDSVISADVLLSDPEFFTNHTESFLGEIKKLSRDLIYHVNFLRDKESLESDFKKEKSDKAEDLVDTCEALKDFAIRRRAIENVQESILNGIEKFRNIDSFDEIEFYEKISIKLKRLCKEIEDKVELEADATKILIGGFRADLEVSDIALKDIDVSFKIKVSADSEFYCDAMDFLQRHKMPIKASILSSLGYKKVSEDVNLLDEDVPNISPSLSTSSYIQKTTIFMNCWAEISKSMIIKSCHEDSVLLSRIKSNISSIESVLHDIHIKRNEIIKAIKSRKREVSLVNRYEDLTVLEFLEIDRDRILSTIRNNSACSVETLSVSEKTIGIDSLFSKYPDTCRELIRGWVNSRGVHDIEVGNYIGRVDKDRAIIYHKKGESVFSLPLRLTHKIIEKGGSLISSVSFYKEDVIKLRGKKVSVCAWLNENDYSLKRRVV